MPNRKIKELVNGELNSLYKISKRGVTIFTPRAILNVELMLRDSKVALEVRNQTLNIIESAMDEHKTMEITKEKELLMAIMFATNEIERATAINEHPEYTKRHTKQLEETIEKQEGVIEHKQEVIKGEYSFELAYSNNRSNLLESFNEPVSVDTDSTDSTDSQQLAWLIRWSVI